MQDVRDTLSAQAGLLNELLTDAIRPTLEEHAMSLPLFELLSAVRSAGTRAHQAEVAERLGIAPPTLTEAARLAAGKGWLEQVPSPTDGRARHLRLTRKGERAVSEVLKAVNLAERAMVEGINPDALATAIDTLRQANRNLARTTKARRESP